MMKKRQKAKNYILFKALNLHLLTSTLPIRMSFVSDGV
jgi:hypothetical protein